MRVRLRYFASIRERLGRTQEEVDLPDGTTVSDLWDRLVAQQPALAMQRYSQFIGEAPTRILATGGASRNAGILQVIADVFQAEVRTLHVGNSSALGGALRAANALGGDSFDSLFERFAAPDPKLCFRPNPKADYAALRTRFETEVDRLTSS